MARRGENIYLRKDGRYEGRFIKGYRSDRKPIFGSVYGRKYSECKLKLAEMKQRYRGENLSIRVYGTGRVADYLIYWLYHIARPCIRTSTFANYASIIDRRLVPFFQTTQLMKLEREDVQSLINYLTQQKLSPGTVRNIYHVLSSALKSAKEYGYLYSNPCDGVRIPQVLKKEAAVLSIQEQKLLEEAANADKNGFSILFAVYTGLRVGELCALKWNDIDFKSGVLCVSATRQRVKSFSPDTNAKTSIINGFAKSQRSVRIIPLPAHLLKKLQEQQKLSSGDYVFMCKGHALEPRILQYRFKVLLKKAGLKSMNFHALRHTFSTRCMELNFDIKTLSELLGHSSAALTLDKYGHSQIEHKRAVMKSLDKLFVKTA